jgi:hypothetical protein
VLGVEGLSSYGFTRDFWLWILGFAIEDSSNSNVVGGRLPNFFRGFTSHEAIKVFSKHMM